MRYRKLDNLGDAVFGHSEQDFYRDQPEAVGQSVQTRLQLWNGEWFLDINEGTLWPQGVLGKHLQAQADTTIQNRAGKTEGLTDIKNYESIVEPNTRKYSSKFDIDTVYGPTEVQLDNYRNF